VLSALLLLMLGGAAFGAERFPPPQFEEGHQLPPTEYPGPKPRTDVYGYLDRALKAVFGVSLGPEVYGYVDVAVLVIAVGAASYLALRRRSRNAIFILMLVSLAYFGFLRKGCVCPIGAIQNVTLAVFDSGYVLPLTVLAFFFLPLLATLLFGRAFCAAVCPLGAIQDVVLARPVKVPGWLEHGLRVLAYVYLGAAVLFAAMGAAFLICDYDPFVGLFRLSGSFGMILFGACFLVLAMFIGRPYCRFLCPYGVLLGLLSRVSRWRVTITPDQCVRCRLCEESCPFGAIRKPAEAPTAHERAQGRTRFLALLGLLPALIAAGFAAGGFLGTPFSKMHPRVALAELVRLEQTGKLKGTTDALDAFRESGEAADHLSEEAKTLRGQFVTGGRLFGAWVGLVIGVKLLHLSIRRRRTDYEADRGACVACGRCFEYCPVELKRRKKAADERD